MARLELMMRFDLRAPEWGTPSRELYATMLDMAAWADVQGFDVVRVSEHHSSEDGYCPSPLIALAAIAARTSSVRLRAMALLLPLYDPLRVAEDVAVLDQISGGRAELAIGAGYRHEEFEMFGRKRKDRVALVESGIDILRKAWTGEKFRYKDMDVRITPRPLQPGGPPILLCGSSAAAARRAARIADGFAPMDTSLFAHYEDELRVLGKQVPASFPRMSPAFVYVAEDPELAWSKLGRHALHETNSYASWLDGDAANGPFDAAAELGAVRENPAYRVVTPEECVALIRDLGPHAIFTLHPLISGLDPVTAWEGLELFATKVLPHLPDRLRRRSATR
jgi:alkanesulfonate monooxygenase SsuD/methylene tetrahydromethanopterin reductase-like flavin-dependent oxidoreductase (luciferase family)